jgi:hypothetical protein
MEARTGELYLKFDQDRKQREALEADQQDEADLKALEAKLKRRPKIDPPQHQRSRETG